MLLIFWLSVLDITTTKFTAKRSCHVLHVVLSLIIIIIIRTRSRRWTVALSTVHDHQPLSRPLQQLGVSLWELHVSMYFVFFQVFLARIWCSAGKQFSGCIEGVMRCHYHCLSIDSVIYACFQHSVFPRPRPRLKCFRLKPRLQLKDRIEFMSLSGLVVSTLAIRAQGPVFESRVAPLFHWVATLGKLFTHTASPVSQLQESGVQKRVFGTWVVMVIKCAR